MTTKLNPLDSTNLRQTILDTHTQIANGLKIAAEAQPELEELKEKLAGKIDALVVCGMGGSTMPGYLLQMLLDVPFPVITHADYDLPKQLPANPLFFISSFSGNTEETLSSFGMAKEKKLPMVLFANGGKLEELATEHKLPFLNYQIDAPGFQPRYALPTTFSVMAQTVSNLGLAADQSPALTQTAEFLKNLSNLEEAGQKLVQEIKGRIPIFYTDNDLRYVAMINKIKINENAKYPAFWNFYPELNHNEFLSYVNAPKDQLVVITLKNPKAHPRNLKRIAITNEILAEKGIKLINLEIKGADLTQQIFYALCLGDWLSYYLALELGQDPAPVELVEKLKKQLG